MAYLAIERQGNAKIGSAFHIGEGVFVTARHVVENATITEIGITDERLFYRSELYPKNDNGSYTIDPPPLKWSDLKYVFDIKEDSNGKEAIQA
jgi:hypothetical protein